MSPPAVLQVAINAPLSRLFDYLPPADGKSGTKELLEPGSRVIVPFGRQQQTGVIVAHADHSDLPRSRLRRAISALDPAPLFGAADLWLLRFASDYYHHSIGEVVAAALPALAAGEVEEARRLSQEALTIASDSAQEWSRSIALQINAEVMLATDPPDVAGAEAAIKTASYAWWPPAKAARSAKTIAPACAPLRSSWPRYTYTSYRSQGIGYTLTHCPSCSSCSPPRCHTVEKLTLQLSDLAWRAVGRDLATMGAHDQTAAFVHGQRLSHRPYT